MNKVNSLGLVNVVFYSARYTINGQRHITSITICFEKIIILQQVAGGNAISIIVLLMIWDRTRVPKCLVTVMQFV